MTEKLWEPSAERVQQSNMYCFMQTVNQRYDRRLQTYEALYHWSVNHISDFWAALWDFAPVIASRAYTYVVDDLHKMPGARWFEGAQLNFTENLLRFRDERTALIFQGEGRPPVYMTYAELYDEVSRVSNALRNAGVAAGDRVAGFMPNLPQTLVAMLAAASLGAVWSSCSPDFGTKGVLDRFGQIRPKILFAADGYKFKGKSIDSLQRTTEVAASLPDIQQVVVVPYRTAAPDIRSISKAVHYADFIASAPTERIDFVQLPFDHPLYIMYSSGTTGKPKCMVQSAGGILVNHLKELMLHTDLKRTDTIFYFTTCGWMMWNWLASSLAVGAALVLFDGSPFHPHPGVLWEMAEAERITIFGTSAGYLNALQGAGVQPVKSYDLQPLRTLLSTGSPLSAEGFEYVYQHIKADLQLASISGGTDLNGCFALGHPFGPVYAGELQGRGLGMRVEAFDKYGRSVINQKGELVCTAPFPSMPIYFWNDPDGRKYRQAYFTVYPHVWRHGDFIEINGRGGVVIYGRSDATLNPGGVRIGTSEIYNVLEPVEEIEDSVVIGQTWKNDIRIVLFVKLSEGHALTPALREKIRRTIRRSASPRHVPQKIIAVPAVPYTRNMKKVELAVKKMIENQPVHNLEALSNPEALAFYQNLEELQKD